MALLASLKARRRVGNNSPSDGFSSLAVGDNKYPDIGMRRWLLVESFTTVLFFASVYTSILFHQILAVRSNLLGIPVI